MLSPPWGLVWSHMIYVIHCTLLCSHSVLYWSLHNKLFCNHLYVCSTLILCFWPLQTEPFVLGDLYITWVILGFKWAQVNSLICLLLADEEPLLSWLGLFLTFLGHPEVPSVWGHHVVPSSCWWPYAASTIVLGVVSGSQTLQGPQMFVSTTAELSRRSLCFCSKGDIFFLLHLRG